MKNTLALLVLLCAILGIVSWGTNFNSNDVGAVMNEGYNDMIRERDRWRREYRDE